QTPAECVVSGAITASGQSLPGVVVSLVDANGNTIDASSSGPDGTFAVKAPASAGSLTLNATLVAFAPISRQLTIDGATCGQRVDLTMTLASRATQNAGAALGATTGTTRTPLAGRGPSGRGQSQTPGGRGQQFQSLELLADQSGLARAEDGGN